MYPTVAPLSTIVMNDDDGINIRQHQETLTDSMVAAIIGAEDDINENKELFDEEILHLYIIYDDQKQQDK